MSKFFSLLNLGDLIPSDSGLPEKDLYVDDVDINGVACISKHGKSSVYNLIQAALPDTLIYNILNKYSSGDDTVLSRGEGAYIDILNAPKDIIAASQLMRNTVKLFESLPSDLRLRYHNNPSEFMAAADKDFDGILKDYFPAPSAAPSAAPSSESNNVKE